MGYANGWAVGQPIVVSTNVGQSTAGVVQSPTPTGTVQFYANGQPLGPPAPVNEVVDGLGRAVGGSPIQTPGTYTITASYSGDANFAPSTGTDTLPIVVEYNLPTYLPVATPSSLTLAAGATTGNTLVITMQSLNNCECVVQWNTTFAPVPGTPTPGNPAAINFPTATGDFGDDNNGNSFFTVAVLSAAPSTITVTAQATPHVSKPETFIAAAALLLLLPLSLRRFPPALLLALVSVALLSSLVGCTGTQPIIPTTTETIPGGAGQYYITVTGETYYSGPQNLGTYFSAQIPVTIH
jgi:hypothetical protein